MGYRRKMFMFRNWIILNMERKLISCFLNLWGIKRKNIPSWRRLLELRLLILFFMHQTYPLVCVFSFFKNGNFMLRGSEQFWVGQMADIYIRYYLRLFTALPYTSIRTLANTGIASVAALHGNAFAFPWGGIPFFLQNNIVADHGRWERMLERTVSEQQKGQVYLHCSISHFR